MLIGLPGSGKSTYAKEHLLNDNTIYLSSDDLRIELFGFEDQTHNADLFEEMNRRCKTALRSGKDVVYDATNLSRKRRKHFISTICKGFDVDAILFCCPIDIIRGRNINREERHLPSEKLEQLITNIDVPLYYEGFKQIYVINTFPGKYSSIIEEPRKALKYKQYNPHHNRTVGEHSLETACYLAKDDSYLLYGNIYDLVSVFHDLGKMYTQVFDEDNIAHYFRHEKVSAYIWMCHKAEKVANEIYLIESEDDIVASMIVHHMDLFNSNTTKLKEKLGDTIYWLLEKFHEADKYRS